MQRVLLAVLVLTPLAWPVAASADETKQSIEPELHKVAISASMLRPVVAKMGEVGAELRIQQKMAASMTLGLGPAKVDSRNMAGDFSAEDVVCFSGGAQFRYYLWGNFDRGLFGGAEAIYIRLSRDVDTTVRPKHEGVWAGPTIGYKHTFSFGMMLSAVATVGLPLYKPDGLDEDEVPGEPTEDDAPVVGGALLWPNVVVGWAL